ncbi:MAG: hypothetical protein J0H74_35635 [Chitinophagaceae bacterium]|nr:hypothetical protein [Chitinophagaceae bacterium]
MLYFLIKIENELQVRSVMPEDELLFRLLYGQKILVEGGSIPDVLQQFDELPLIISNGV